MNIPGYTIDLEQEVQTIKQKKYNQVLLQLPEGLKGQSTQFVRFLEQHTPARILLSADLCFGACDLNISTAKEVGVDYVIQLGHTPIPSMKNTAIPTSVIPAFSTLDITKVVTKSLSHLTGKTIGVVTTAQHLHMLDKASEILTTNGFTPLISKGDNRIAESGQILGCNFSSALSIREKVDSYLFIGSGTFHPIGLLLSTKKPVVAADPYTNQVHTQELDNMKDTILRQRYGAIAHSKNAKCFGILVGLKQGQQRMKQAIDIQETLQKRKKKSLLIALDYVSPGSLDGYRDIDCFVSTACPRIAIDDYLQYKRPIITPIELEIVLDKRPWEAYEFDQFLE